VRVYVTVPVGKAPGVRGFPVTSAVSCAIVPSDTVWLVIVLPVAVSMISVVVLETPRPMARDSVSLKAWL
jgi:hypothetical protein